MAGIQFRTKFEICKKLYTFSPQNQAMYIDIFLSVFILLGAIQGYHRGIVRTVFTILGVIIGSIAAIKFSPYVVTFLETSIKLSPLVSLLCGLILTFLVIMIGIWWLGQSIEKTMKLVKLNIINRIAGAALYTVLMVIAYSAIVWFISRTDLMSDAQKTQSVSYPALMQVPRKTGAMIEKLKPVFHEFWEKIEGVIDSDGTQGSKE